MVSIARVAAAAAVAMVVGAGPAFAEDYGVFCANGRIEIDSRSADEMRSNRSACQFGRFPTRSDAESFARRNFGGAGASCSCR